MFIGRIDNSRVVFDIGTGVCRVTRARDVHEMQERNVEGLRPLHRWTRFHVMLGSVEPQVALA